MDEITQQNHSCESTVIGLVVIAEAPRRVHEVSPESPDDGGKSALEIFVDWRPNPEESC